MEGEVLLEPLVEGISKPTFTEAAVVVQIVADISEAGTFSVQEYNNAKKGKSLGFDKVLLAWKKEVENVGIFYNVILQAHDDGRTKLYSAVVYQAAVGGNKKYLLLFKCIYAGMC